MCFVLSWRRPPAVPRVGQNHLRTVYIPCLWQENHQIYGVYVRFWPALAIPVTTPLSVSLAKAATLRSDGVI